MSVKRSVNELRMNIMIDGATTYCHIIMGDELCEMEGYARRRRTSMCYKMRVKKDFG